MGRKSTLDKLPPEVKLELDALLKNKRYTQKQIAAMLTDYVQECLGEQEEITERIVNRYAATFNDVMAKREESAIVVKQWIDRMGDVPSGDFGRAIVEILRQLSFDMSIVAHQNGVSAEDLPATVKMLKDLSTAVEKIERSASENEKREAEVAKRAAQKAREESANKVEAMAQQQGLTAEQAQFWREQILMGA